MSTNIGTLPQSNFWTPTPGSFHQLSTLGREQKPLYNQLLGASQGRGAGGAFGEAADYYRDLLSNRGGDFQAFAEPEMRRFREDLIPSLAEQFAAGGYGGIGGSGFRNASTRAATDLSERLAALRANIRQSAAQGLKGIGEQGLNQFNENMFVEPSEGLLAGLLKAFANAGGSAVGIGGGQYLGKKFAGG